MRPLFFLVFLLAACTRVSSQGDSCTLNSDCAAPLVCAASTCRPQCRQDRDCTAGETCHGVGDTAVCVPAGMAVPCAFSSQCDAHQACVGGTCRATCSGDGDCAGGSCVMGACSMPVLGDPDAGAGCAGARCGGRCVDLQTDAEHCGACAIACATGSVCSAGSCVGCDATMPGCVPSYDACDTPLVVEATMREAIIDVPPGTTDSTPSCNPGGDFYVDVHAADRALVYVNALCVGSQGYVQNVDSCAAPLISCLDCDGATAEVNGSSAHFQVECGNDTTLRIDRIPLSGTTDVERWPASGMLDAMVSLPAGTGMGLCGATGASHVYYIDPCRLVGGTVTTDVCGTGISAAFIDASGGINCPSESTLCAGGASLLDALDGASVAALVVSATTPVATTAHVTAAIMAP